MRFPGARLLAPNCTVCDRGSTPAPPSRPQNVIVTQRTASRRDQEPQRCPRALEPPAAAGTSSQGAQGRPGPHAAPRHMVGSDRQLQRPGQGHCPARFQPSCAPGPGQAVGRPRRRGRWRAVPVTTGRPSRLRSPAAGKPHQVSERVQDRPQGAGGLPAGPAVGRLGELPGRHGPGGEPGDHQAHGQRDRGEGELAAPATARGQEGARGTAAPRRPAESPRDGSEGAPCAQGCCPPAGPAHTPRVCFEVQEAKVTEVKINEARENYRPAAERASLLYFILNDLNKINPIYQFSLKVGPPRPGRRRGQGRGGQARRRRWGTAARPAPQAARAHGPRPSTWSSRWPSRRPAPRTRSGSG